MHLGQVTAFVKSAFSFEAHCPPPLDYEARISGNSFIGVQKVQYTLNLALKPFGIHVNGILYYYMDNFYMQDISGRLIINNEKTTHWAPPAF